MCFLQYFFNPLVLKKSLCLPVYGSFMDQILSLLKTQIEFKHRTFSFSTQKANQRTGNDNGCNWNAARYLKTLIGEELQNSI